MDITGSPGLLGNKCHLIVKGLSKWMNGITENQLPPQNGTAFKAFWFRNLSGAAGANQLLLKPQRISWAFWVLQAMNETKGIGTSTGFCRFNSAYAWPGKRLWTLHTPWLHAGSQILNKTYFLRWSPACCFSVYNHFLQWTVDIFITAPLLKAINQHLVLASVTQVKELNRSTQGNISGLICEEAAVKALTGCTLSPDRDEIKAPARTCSLK